ncbi:MAG: MarR family transcriptional regulator [Rhodobacteraceae bacterium]|nr:MarR family transcriptional regulator [Paracoccaceae bacterium]
MSDLELNDFFPYQVRIFYRSVSDSVAKIYAAKFDLTVSEWRIMAVLGPQDMFSASELVARSSLGKVNVSRAIKGLKAAGYVRRDIDSDDKRRAVVRLTAKGRQVLATLVPLVKAREAELFEGLEANEKQQLLGLMQKVKRNADRIIVA